MPKRMRLFGDPCKDCGNPLTEFNSLMKGPYLQTRCRECDRKREQTHRPSRSPEARADYYTEWKFGLVPEEYLKKLELQLGGCAICKKPCEVRNRLAVDHNHKTDKIRDLLCHRCNVVLGLVEEDELLLSNLIDYIKRHEQKIA